MSLKKCPECKKEISSDARVCPHCGKKLTGLAEMIAAILIVAFLIFAFLGNDTSETEKQLNLTRSAEMSVKLNKELLHDKDIQDIKIEVNNNSYSADIYVTNIYISPENIAKKTIKKMLDILIAEGRNPYKEKIGISAFIQKASKGATGQDTVIPFGRGRYDWFNDRIVWSDWDESKFTKFGKEKQI